MASTYSPSLRIELMATGDQSGTWGDTTNTNLGTLLEQAITGVLSKSMGDANQTLTNLDGASDEARNMVVIATGTLTAGRDIIVPTANKVYLVKNSTSGGFAVTVKTSAGSGVTVPATTARWVYCDGTNVVDGMSGPWSPSSNDAQALGLSGTAWSDLFLASGAVINFSAGDVTITHSTNALAFAGATSGYSFDDAVSASSANAGFVGFRATSTNSGAAAGPIIELYRDSATPAANDILGQVLFNGEDSAGNTQEYASIQTVVADPTSASEDSTLDFYTQVGGTRTLALSLTGENRPFGAMRVQVFSGSGTYTPNANLLYCFVEGVGGGGGGGGVNGNAGRYFTGTGGGSGAYSSGVFTAAQIGASQAVTIGAAGSAGAAAGPGSGGNGGDTSLGSLLVAKGGVGGVGGSSVVGPVLGGTGGAAASGTGDVRINGQQGDSGAYIQVVAITVPGGRGGSSLLGAGGSTQTALSTTFAGFNASGPGGGGAGAVSGDSDGIATGGTGAAGILLIYEFCSA